MWSWIVASTMRCSVSADILARFVCRYARGM
jgi:hypothetical protein